ncbi:MAG TPA: DUF4129 domain-containing protein [Frankiaceae bacterium]|jgi:hypothetical protein|nr:DUF4129 domain-containing protein [Frankiaceae bacterium]
MTASITRDGAAHQAHSELTKHVYQQARPSITQQIESAVWRWLVRAYHRIIDVTPGGAVGLLVIIAVLALVAVVFTRSGVSGRRRGGGATGLDLPADVSSDELRAAADGFAVRGEWAEAVRARLRAVVRSLEERGVLDPRPGRTAAEVAAEAGSARPEWRDQLWKGALTFGEIWYGRRPATSADDAVLREVDAVLRRSRSQPAGVAVGPAGFRDAPPPR